MFPFFKKGDQIPKHLADSNSNLTKEAQWQLERSTGYVRKLSQRFPNLWLIAGGAGATFLLLSARDFYLQQEADKEIKYRASQLALPPYELKGEELYNFPWNENNLHEWLYRPVIITGRPRHSQAMQIPRRLDSKSSF